MSEELISGVRAKLDKIDDFIESSSDETAGDVNVDTELDAISAASSAGDRSHDCLVENEFVGAEDGSPRLLFSYNYIEIDEILNRLVDSISNHFKMLNFICDDLVMLMS